MSLKSHGVGDYLTYLHSGRDLREYSEEDDVGQMGQVTIE